MFGEDSFLDSYMEDMLSGGYGTLFDAYDPDWNGTDWSDPYDREWAEAEFERGFNEAHARSEEMSDEELDAYYARFGI